MRGRVRCFQASRCFWVPWESVDLETDQGRAQASLQGASPQLSIPVSVTYKEQNWGTSAFSHLSPRNSCAWVVCSKQSSFPSLSPCLCCRAFETELCSSSYGISDEPVETQTVHGSLKPLPFIKEQPDMLWDWKIPKTDVNMLEFGIKLWPLPVTHETTW